MLGWVNWQRQRHRQHRRDVLDALVADMQSQHPDHILVSGDLTNIGLPGEIAAALDWLRSLGPPDRVTVIPGNHDVYGRMWHDPGLARWNPYMASNAAGSAFSDAAPGEFPFVRVLHGVALVGANSAVPTPPLFASGKLAPAQTARLGGCLKRLGEAGLPRIVAIHHAPLPGQASRTRGLVDAKAVSAVIARSGAELIVHGHHHRLMQAWLPSRHGAIPVLGVPSASAAEGAHSPAASYHLIRFTLTKAGCAITVSGRTMQPGGGFAGLPISLTPPA